jgi:membrane fusion protein, type I secretion system
MTSAISDIVTPPRPRAERSALQSGFSKPQQKAGAVRRIRKYPVFLDVVAGEILLQREAQGKLAELVERMAAAEDQLKRIDIRAPRWGIVNSLAIHTVGGVIGNGETIMQVVPHGDELIVEAKVAPQDIDQLGLGAPAVVRIMAGNQRTMPELTGVLTHVSADLTREQANAAAPALAYYVVRASLPEAEIARLGEFRLFPGMPAEVFIQTQARTPLQYLIKPLREQIARSFRER